MDTVSMWSISIPEESSVREVEQAVASILQDFEHISVLTMNLMSMQQKDLKKKCYLYLFVCGVLVWIAIKVM